MALTQHHLDQILPLLVLESDIKPVPWQVLFTYTNRIVPLWFRGIQIAVWGLSGALFCGLEAKIGTKTVKITFFSIFRYPTVKKNKKKYRESFSQPVFHL